MFFTLELDNSADKIDLNITKNFKNRNICQRLEKTRDIKIFQSASTESECLRISIHPDFFLPSEALFFE